MVVTLRDAIQVALKRVAAKEELTDVRANIVLDDETAAGMLVDECADVKHQVV